MEAARQVAPVFQRQPPIFYAGDELTASSRTSCNAPACWLLASHPPPSACAAVDLRLFFAQSRLAQTFELQLVHPLVAEGPSAEERE
jgi:hypothetical protein